MKKYVLTTIIIFSIFLLPLSAEMTAEQIIKEMDKMETFNTSFSTGRIISHDRFGDKVSEFNAWSRGTEDSLIEFTSLAERGQKVLRTEKNLYLFYPDANELIRLQGAALRQSLLGSDISYEDMTAERSTLDDYDVSLDGRTSYEGHEVYIVRLEGKSRKVAYPTQTLLIDVESYLVWKGEYATKSGRLLKEMTVLETMEVGERTLPKKSKIVDVMKSESYTIMELDSIETDIPLEGDFFSLDSLTW